MSVKMSTIRQLAVGTHDWEDSPDQARIERNLFHRDGEEPLEALRFCKNRNGRHNRVHLVITEEEFIPLFRSAVENGVFHEDTLAQLRTILAPPPDPFLDVIGIGSDGKLATDIDSDLYGSDKT